MPSKATTTDVSGGDSSGFSACATIVKDEQSKKRYVLPSMLSVEAKKIYRVMGVEHSEVPYRLD